MTALGVGTTRGVRWWRRARTRPLQLLSGAVTVALCVLLLYPVLTMGLRTFVLGSDVLGLDDVTRVFGDDHTVAALRNTAIILLTAGPLALLVGGLLAWLNERTDARLGLVGELLPIASLLVPPIAGSIAWTFLLAPRAGLGNVAMRGALDRVGVHLTSGPVDVFSWYGVVLAYTAYMVPYAYLPLAAALRGLDPGLEEAAAVSGSSPLVTVVRVTVPAIKPAALTAVFLVTVACLGIYSVPSVLGTRSGIDVV